MSEQEEFDTSYEDEVICPHCGYCHEASYELLSNDTCDGDTTTTVCDECGEEIVVTFHLEPRYSTAVPPPAVRLGSTVRERARQRVDAAHAHVDALHLYEVRTGDVVDVYIARVKGEARAMHMETDPGSDPDAVLSLDDHLPYTITEEDGSKVTHLCAEWGLIAGPGPLASTEAP